MDGAGGRQVPIPSMNPKAQSHEALKAMTDAADPAGAQAVADGWGELASGFDEAAQLFQRTIAGSTEGWTGTAADGMRAQLTRIAEWSEQTGAQYRAASAAIAEQSGAAGSAKRNMPPPVPYDPAQMIKDARASGNIFEMAALPFAMYAQKQRHDAAHDQAAEIVASRDGSFAAAASSIPAFIPPPVLTSEPRPETEAAPPSAAPPAGALPPPRTRGDRVAPPPSDPTPSERPSVATPGPAAPSPGATRPEQFASDAAAASGPSGANPGGTLPAQAAPAPNPGGTMPAAAPQPPSAAGTGPGPGFGPGNSAPGIGFGGTRPAGFVPGGFGPGGGFPQGLGGARVPLPPPGPGLGSMPLGRREKGAEDTEQKRPKFLVEPDIEGMFGSDELTSPPVIGEG